MKALKYSVWRQLQRQERRAYQLATGNSMGFIPHKEIGSVSMFDREKLSQLKIKLERRMT